MANRNTKATGIAKDADLEQALLNVKVQKAEAELQEAMVAIAKKHGVDFQFALGGISIKAVPK